MQRKMEKDENYSKIFYLVLEASTTHPGEGIDRGFFIDREAAISTARELPIGHVFECKLIATFKGDEDH